MKNRTRDLIVIGLLSAAFAVSGCGGGTGDDGVPPGTGSPSASSQIQAVRDALDGAVSLPVDGGVVTYVTTSIGTDPAGFFIQADQAGPAIFLAVDPTTLAPVPAAGDAVDLTITEMITTNGMRQAAAIEGYSRVEQGISLAGLTQDVNAATDLVSSVDAYEAELVATSATITAAFSSAGTGFVEARVETDGIAGEPNLLLRMPSALHTMLTASYGLAPGCRITLQGTPLWRNGAAVQLSAWNAEDIVVDSCPAPAVAVTIAPTAVTVDQGGMQQFTANVANAANTAVIWSSTCGNVNSSGLFTAPAAAGTCQVTASSVQDPAKFASANVTVPAVSVSVSPTSATTVGGGTVQFTAAVSGTVNKTVTWTASGLGSVSSGGLFSAPNICDTSIVRATSVADPAKYAAATVTMLASGVCP